MMFGLSLGLAVLAVADEKKDDKKDDQGWIRLFDGKSLKGWEASENPDGWKVEDGCIVGTGPRSHLFYKEREFTDFEYKADVMINEGGNSGMYFRTEFGPGWPKGYEAQVNSTHRDPKRTGSLYNFVNQLEQITENDVWFNQHVICKGNHIIIKVNGKTTVDYVDEKNTYKKGYFALQQHHEGSVVKYKNVMVKPLD